MRAIVFRKSKGLGLEEVSIPIIDKDQVLIKVSNTGFCGSDHSLVETDGTPDGIILGHEVSGRVVEIGSNVKGVEAGMKVIVRPTYCGSCWGCRIGRPQLCSNNRRSIGIGDLSGGFAEYVKVFPQMLIPVPDGVNSINAALAEAFAVALHAVDLTGREKGSVLVIGAGAIGLALVKVLKIRGFGPILVSEPVQSKRELAQQFGADAVIDPMNDDLLTSGFQITKGTGFEIVYECVGIPELISTAMNAVGAGGVVCQLSVIYQDISINPAMMTFKEISLLASYGNTHEENKQCLQWMAEGRLDSSPLVSDLVLLEDLPEIYQSRIQSGKAIKVMLQIGEEF